jgi:hypothetical protein
VSPQIKQVNFFSTHHDEPTPTKLDKVDNLMYISFKTESISTSKTNIMWLKKCQLLSDNQFCRRSAEWKSNHSAATFVTVMILPTDLTIDLMIMTVKDLAVPAAELYSLTIGSKEFITKLMVTIHTKKFYFSVQH